MHLGSAPGQVLHAGVCSGGVLFPLPAEGCDHHRVQRGGRAEGQHGGTEGGAAGHLCSLFASADEQTHITDCTPACHSRTDRLVRLELGHIRKNLVLKNS